MSQLEGCEGRGTHSVHPSRVPSWRAFVGCVVALTISPAATSKIPENWVGELEVEQDVPQFSPVGGAVVAAKTTGKFLIRASAAGIQGRGTMPYRSTLQFAGCTGESVGEWTVVARGRRTSVTAGLPSLQPLMTQLTFEFERSGSTTTTVNCPRAPPQVPVTRAIPSVTQTVTMPFADGESWSTERAFGPGVLGNKVTVNLPCAWDTRQPPGPKVRFSPDPRRQSIYSGTFDTSKTRLVLTQEDLSRRFPGGVVPPSGQNAATVRGMTEVPKWFVENLDAVSVVAAKTGEGFCAWSGELVFMLPPVKQYIAREIAARAGSRCDELVRRHEREHADKAQRLLVSTVNELDRDLRAIPGEFDADLVARDLGAKDSLDSRIRAVVDRVRARYDTARQQLKADVDDVRTPEHEELTRACRGEGF